MGTKKEVLEYLNKEWQMKIGHLLTLNSEIKEREENRRALLEHLKKLLSFFESVGGQPPTSIPTELQESKRPLFSLGDTMATLLQEKGGSMPKTDLMKALKDRLAGKNARIILKNAIKRDAQQRFRMEMRTIFLNTPREREVLLEIKRRGKQERKKKADAKS